MAERLRANPIQGELEETDETVPTARLSVCFLSVIPVITSRYYISVVSQVAAEGEVSNSQPIGMYSGDLDKMRYDGRSISSQLLRLHEHDQPAMAQCEYAMPIVIWSVICRSTTNIRFRRSLSLGTSLFLMKNPIPMTNLFPTTTLSRMRASPGETPLFSASKKQKSGLASPRHSHSLYRTHFARE